MSEQSIRLGQREERIVELLLQGCDNDEIARQLHIACRTVKAHFNRLFLRFGITSGVKRVKLATLLYRRQLRLEANVAKREAPVSERPESSNLLPKAQPCANRRVQWENDSLVDAYASDKPPFDEIWR